MSCAPTSTSAPDRPKDQQNTARLFLSFAVIRAYSASGVSFRRVLARFALARPRTKLPPAAELKGSAHDRCRQQELHRPDREHRLGLSFQQSDAGLGDSEPDQPDSRGPDAGLERSCRRAGRAGKARGVAEEVD